MRWHAVVIVMATAAVYANSFGNAFVWDDRHLVLENPAIKSWGGFWSVWTSDLFPALRSQYYRPLQAFTYLIDYQFWRLNPFGYHLTNTLLHAAVALLFYRLAIRLTGRPRAAVSAALLFAVHPIHTEAVTYIAGRADPLSAFFILAALLCFTADRHAHRQFPLWRLAALAAFGLALLSRETGVVLLPLLIVVDVAMRHGSDRREPWRWQQAAHYLPYLVVLALYGWARAGAVGTASIPSPLAEVPLELRLATMLGVIVRYVALLIVPIHQHMERTVAPATALYDPAVLGAALCVAALALLAWWCRRRAWPVTAGIVWFLVALAPASNIVPLATFMAEHWIYVPSMGLFLAVGWAVDRALSDRQRVAVGVALALALVIFGSLTIRRNRDWRDEVAIFEATIRHAPHSLRALSNLGEAYMARGELDRAEQIFREILALDRPGHNLAYASVHNNLGLVLRTLGRFDEAKEQFHAALRRDPGCLQAYGNLGNLHSNLGELDEAITAYRAALQLDPNSARARNNLATLYAKVGRLDLAEQELRRAVEIDPDLEDARRNLEAVVKARSGVPAPPP